MPEEPEKILTVKDLMVALSDLDSDAPVMIAVVKYPHMFPIAVAWEDSPACELVAIEGEEGNILMKDGIALIVAELTDYEEEKREALTA